jgi:hypothetical protein
MHTYRLDPIPSTEDYPCWSRSTLRERVWVWANSENQARDRVISASSKASERTANGQIAGPPWRQPALTTCVVDTKPPVEVPEDAAAFTWGDVLLYDPTSHTTTAQAAATLCAIAARVFGLPISFKAAMKVSWLLGTL